MNSGGPRSRTVSPARSRRNAPTIATAIEARATSTGATGVHRGPGRCSPGTAGSFGFTTYPPRIHDELSTTAGWLVPALGHAPWPRLCRPWSARSVRRTCLARTATGWQSAATRTGGCRTGRRSPALTLMALPFTRPTTAPTRRRGSTSTAHHRPANRSGAPCRHACPGVVTDRAQSALNPSP